MKLLILMFLLASCSSMKKSIFYSSLIGGVAGATGGALLSPDRESRGWNAAIFGLTGAAVSALAGYLMYEDDPRNRKLENMLLPEEKKDPNVVDIGLGELKIEAKLDKREAYKVPVKELPDKLKGKVKKQYLIKYESKERYINSGNKTFYIPTFEVFEHSYDEKIGDGNE